MSPYDQFPARPDVSELNEAATRELAEKSAETCAAIVTYVRNALTVFLDEDRKLDELARMVGVQEGEVLDYYILEDMLAVPEDTTAEAADVQPAFQPSLVMKLRSSRGEVTSGSDELLVYVPVPESFNFGVDPVPPTAGVFIEHRNIQGDKTRYAISEMGFSAYSTLSDGGQVTEFDTTGDLGDELTDDTVRMADGLYKRVDSGLPALAKIYENLVNMEVVPQRRIVAGQSRPIDL